MRTVNYKEKDYDELFLEMMEDAYEYNLVSTDERFLDYIKNREDIENNYCLFLSVYAFENNKIYEDMTSLYNSNDIDKCYGQDLDILGNNLGIPRPQARKSSVELTFYLQNSLEYDFTIPSGTIVTTDGGTAYYTVEDAVIIRGQLQTNVTAYSSYSGYNTRVDRRTLTNCNLQGIRAVTNLKGSSGGRGAYTDEEYRRLIKNWVYSHIKGTKEAYELFFSYYDGIDSYRIIPLWDGAGTIKVIVDPSNDWIINDIQEKLFENVYLLDDDVYVTGAKKRRIDINVNVNVDIDNFVYYSVEQREMIAERVANAIELYIDGGYRRNGRYHTGLLIGQDLVPFQLGIFISEEVPEVRSVDFADTVKNIDNVIYASDFDTDNDGTTAYGGMGYDPSTRKLVASKGRTYTSPLLYIGNAKKLVSDNEGFQIAFIMDGKQIYPPIGQEESGSAFSLEGLDVYGSYIELTALKDGATLGEITIYEGLYGDDDNRYNTHVHIGDEEIAISGDIEVVIEDKTDEKGSNVVCY